MLLGLLSEELEELEESIELELELLTELGVSRELELEESIELELVEYSQELVLYSSDPLLLDDELGSVELLLLEESKELEEVDTLVSERDVRLDSDIELEELAEDKPPKDSLDSLDELNSTEGLYIGTDAQVMIALVIGCPKVIVMKPSPDPL